ncbi:DUF3243 domain-containing protein [Virgibacillus sediminis]|uniref:DUF3243 domain-containing protein n=1 Tax=Virgibacillus sediminis TaxID=202260 RepID=A0ABV7AAI1_9BACI
MSVLDNFDSWKGFLADKLQQAQQQGMNQQTISNMAEEVGDYLAQNVEAKNGEEAVLRELWNAASEEEQQAIANTMIKMVQNQGNN